MKEKNLNMIKELSESFGPSGFEDDVLEVIRKYAKDLGDFEEDSSRNLYLYRKENSGNKPILMLDAHSDELGYIVHYVRPDGLIKLIADSKQMEEYFPGVIVKIRNCDNEDIEGVIVPTRNPRVNDNFESKASIDVLIDVGASSCEEVEKYFKIEMGNPVCFNTNFSYNEKTNIMKGRAFDDRLGCAAIINVLENLRGVNLPFDIVALFSSQEEEGCRGIQVGVKKVNPDIAICLEGTFKKETFQEEYISQTVVNKGALLRLRDGSNIFNPRFTNFIRKIAKEKNIKLQTAVRRVGSTNAHVIRETPCGANVVVISAPVRYGHTPCCYSSYEDYENVIRITTETIKALTPEIISNF